MKILFVTPYYPPHLGGTQLYVHHIARELHRRFRWQIVIATANTTGTSQTMEREHGITVYRLPYRFTLSNTPMNPVWYTQLRDVIAREQPQVINAHAPVPFMADMAALAAGRLPFVLTYHSGPMMGKGKILPDTAIALYERCLLPLLLRRSNRIISSSAYVGKTVLKGYEDKTVIISPGVDTRNFIPDAGSKRTRVLFVGSLQEAEQYKGLDTLLAAIARIRPTAKKLDVIIVGTGDGRKRYEARCKDLGIDRLITFTGSLKGAALVAQYQQAGILVHPSAFDSFPLVLLEAMACNTAVISTTVGGIPEIVHHGKTGLLVPPKNPGMVAAALTMLLENPKRTRQMQTAGRTLVQRQYTWRKQAEATAAVFEEVQKSSIKK